MDRPQLFPQHKDPRSPAQLLVLDAKSAQWRQKYAFGQRATPAPSNTTGPTR
jgi:hypothetical protein